MRKVQVKRLKKLATELKIGNFRVLKKLFKRTPWDKKDKFESYIRGLFSVYGNAKGKAAKRPRAIRA